MYINTDCMNSWGMHNCISFPHCICNPDRRSLVKVGAVGISHCIARQSIFLDLAVFIFYFLQKFVIICSVFAENYLNW